MRSLRLKRLDVVPRPPSFDSVSIYVRVDRAHRSAMPAARRLFVPVLVPHARLGFPPRGRRFARCVPRASIERAKELTKQIIAADDWRDVVGLLRESEDVNLRHLTTAVYFLTRKNRSERNGLRDLSLLKELEGIADRITGSDESWSSASLVNVLQACSHLAEVGNLAVSNSFDSLRSRALGILVAGPNTPLSNVEYLTILSCMVHLPDSPASAGKVAATKAIERALAPGDDGPIQLRAKGLEGFHPRDLGSLAWALTEVKCGEETAQLVYDHCMLTVGAKNLSASALCLACRMISTQGARERAEDNLTRVVAGAGHPSALRGLASLRDSTMLLLAVARMIKGVCEEEVNIEESLSFGAKWTLAVVSYRKAHPPVDRLIGALCTLIGRNLLTPRTPAVGNASKTLPGPNGRIKNPEDGEVSHSVYSGILYSLALLQCPSADVIALCVRGLARVHKKLTLRTIATCTWSLAVLRYEEPHILRVFAKHVVENKLLAGSDQSVMSGEMEAGNRGRKSRKSRHSEYTAQSVSMLLYGFAVLNLLDEDGGGERGGGERGEMAALLGALMRAAKACMAHLGPEALPVLGWSIVIAHSRERSMETEIFESTVQAWRQAVRNAFADIPAQGRPMIHHTEIALSLEAPHLPGCGATADIAFEPLMELLYASGRLRRHALREWNAQSQSVALDGISLFQKQVFAAAERIIPGWQMEYWDERLQYPVDMALPEHRIVIEADGPTHFMTNGHRAVGATCLKHRLLKRLGWRLVVVPYYEWNMDGTDDEHVARLRPKLNRVILNTEPGVQNAQNRGPTTGVPVCVTPDRKQNEQKTSGVTIRQNAETLDKIRALQGKMTLKDAMKRRNARN